MKMIFGGYVTYLSGRSEKVLLQALHLYLCKISVLVFLWPIFTISKALLQYGQSGFEEASVVVFRVVRVVVFRETPVVVFEGVMI